MYEIAPIVSGIKIILYDHFKLGRLLIYLDNKTVNIIPLKLSFAIEGWQCRLKLKFL